MKNALMFLLLLIAPVAYAKTVSNIAVAPQGAVLQSGSSLQFTVTCTYTDGAADDCSAAGGAVWTSSRVSGFTVSATGKATVTADPGANALSNAYVLVSAGSVKDRAAVFTQHPGDTWYEYMTPDYRTFRVFGTQQTLNVAVGSQVALGAGFVINAPDGGHTGVPLQPTCNWSSSDASKATIDRDGTVSALAPGTVTFTCGRAGDGVFGASTQGGWQAPGNVITLTVTDGGTGNKTWYVRTDGGTPFVSSAQTPNGQCDGLSNMPYPGSGTAQHCAVASLSYLYLDQVTYAQIKWMISGGDSVIVEPGTYTLGPPSSNGQPNCPGDLSNCYMPTVPSGSANHHTRILGSNYQSCHANSAKPRLNLAAYTGFNVVDSQFVDVSCFEISDTTACTTSGNYTHHCQAGEAFGGIGVLEDSLSSVTLSDLYIHGLAGDGIHGPSGPGVVMDHLQITGIPGAGINMDNGAWQTNNISNAGGLTLTNSLTEFTGCVEEYPIVHNYPFVECRDQQLGGYGDGFGTANTSGNWVFDHDVWRYNFQDGLDLLHSGMKSLSVTNSQSYGNDGQQYKIGSGQTVLFANNIALHNCERILLPFGDEPASAVLPGVSACRAAGDGIVVSISAFGTDTFQNNTYVGYGGTSFDMACEGGFDTCSNAQSTFQNNINIGLLKPSYNAGQKPGLFYNGSASMPPNGGWAVRDHNLFYNFRNGTGCPAPLQDGEICADANFVNEPSLTVASDLSLDNFNFSLAASSPAKYSGKHLATLNLPTLLGTLNDVLGTDLTGTPRNLVPSMGALEFGAVIGNPSNPSTPAPVPTPTPTPAPTPKPAPPTSPASPGKQKTSVSLIVTPTAAVAGQSVTFKVAVSGSIGVPTGRVNILLGSDAPLVLRLDAAGNGSGFLRSAVVGSYSVVASYTGDKNYLQTNSADVPLEVAASTAVSVSIGQPAFGFNLIPGATRRIFATVKNGSTVGQVTWAVRSGGATLSASAGSWVDVTAPKKGSSCYQAGNGSPTVVSNSSFTVRATSSDDRSKVSEITFNVCKPDVAVSIVPAYRTLYANQSADLQSLIVGSTNENVSWSVASTPPSGDGRLADATLRDTVFTAATPGRYVITATSLADSQKVASATMYVTGHPLPYRATPNRTEPIDCSVDPALQGETYEVGPSQSFKRLQDVPLTSMPAGSTVRLHNEDTSGNTPTVYNELVQLKQAATADQPVRLCGIPDQYGNLPIIDGSRASTGTNSANAGGGLVTIGGTEETASWPTFTGATNIVVEGVHLRNARSEFSYVSADGSATKWSATASCLLVREGHDISVTGVEMEGCGTGGASLWNGSSWNGSSLNHLWEGNYVHDNAAPAGNDQLSLEAWGQVVQFNRIEQITSAGVGANLKSRGIQDVLRYNYFGDGAARDLDLVEVSAAAPFMSFADYFAASPGRYSMDQLAAWQQAWNSHFVYGNIYQNSTSSGPIHFSYDQNGDEPARKGNLFWYNNTFLQPQCTACAGQLLTLFDQSGADGSYLAQTEFPTIQAFNNIVWTNPATTSFQWNNFSAFIGVGVSNLLPISWGANTLQGGVGDGWNNDPNSAAYPDASDLSLHLAGFSGGNTLTTSTLPFGRISWLLRSPQPSTATLPAEVCGMPVRFAYLPSLGYAIPRVNQPNLGATDTAAQTGAIFALGQSGGSSPSRATACQ